MKLLSVAVPCYNSENYMRHCVNTLLPGGEDIEILIVDDGSTDKTGAIADELEREHTGIVRAIHQANAGHGGAVLTGLKNASGRYFKVVDSDDWVSIPALKQVLSTIKRFVETKTVVDLVVSNYIYDKAGASRKKVIRYGGALPKGKMITWSETGAFHKGQYMLMHSLIYRTELLRKSGLSLPQHTFYVDNLYAYTPLAAVRTLYYLDVDLYHYAIGREDQSVQENIMIRRVDQQIRVNHLMLEQVDIEHIPVKRQRNYMFNYLEIVTAISSIILIRAGTPEALEKKEELWRHIRLQYPWVYDRLRRRAIGTLLNLPGEPGRKLCSFTYHVSQRIFGFN